MKTQEIERAIVTVRHDETARSGVSTDVVISTPSTPPKGKKRSVLSEEAFLAALGEYEDGARYVRVARKLLEFVKPPLQVVWASGSFTVKVPDPSGSGAMLSLLAVPLESETYAYTQWLRDQLKKLWGDETAANRIVDAELQVLRQFGAKLGRNGTASFDLLVLEGKESDFVNGLREVAAMIEKEAARRRV